MLGLRLGMGAAVVAVFGAGVFMSGKLERDSRARVATHARAAEEIEAADQASKRDAPFAETAFDDGLVADAAAFGISREGVVDSIRAAQVHHVELEAPVVLAAGRSWESSRLRVEANVDKVQYEKRGASVAARHTLAVVENISRVPLAYFVELSSDARGRCEVHGARQHNAMTLMPGETAEIVVCAGGGKIRVVRAETLEISELGARYLSRVPPRAVGIRGNTALAHVPADGARPCDTVDVAGLSRSLRQGTLRWVDVVDFYSRHSCERFRFVADYRHSPDPPAQLPAQPDSE